MQNTLVGLTLSKKFAIKLFKIKTHHYGNIASTGAKFVPVTVWLLDFGRFIIFLEGENSLESIVSNGSSIKRQTQIKGKNGWNKRTVSLESVEYDQGSWM